MKLFLTALLVLSTGAETLGSFKDNSWMKYAGVLAIGAPLTSFLIFKSVTSSSAEKKARADDASAIEARKNVWNSLERGKTIPKQVIEGITNIQKELGEEHMTAHHMKMKMEKYNAKIDAYENSNDEACDVRACFNNLVGQNPDGSFVAFRLKQQRKKTLIWGLLAGASGLGTAGTCALLYVYPYKK